MKHKLSILLVLAACWAALDSVAAATIPAGTALVLRTTGAISSHAKAGGTFAAKLDQDVVVQGSVVLKVGTLASGVIEASRGNVHRSMPLTLNLTSVSVSGKKIPVKTTAGFEPAAQSKGTRQVRGGFSVGESTYPAGTRIEFRLAHPVNL
jgi:hypothetical protein